MGAEWRPARMFPHVTDKRGYVLKRSRKRCKHGKIKMKGKVAGSSEDMAVTDFLF